jgi:WD40 repeat protein
MAMILPRIFIYLFASIILASALFALDDDDKIIFDPPTTKLVYPEKLPYSELNNVHPRFVLFGPGSFLMTSFKQNNNDFKDNVAVINVQTGKTVGILRNLAMSDNPTFITNRLALSSDGQLLAQYHQPSNGIRIVAVKASKVQRVLPFKANSLVILFTQPDILLAISTDAGMEQATLWQISTGKELLNVKMPSNLETSAGQVSVSPGGRLLAIPEGDNQVIGSNHIGLYDLKVGTKLRDFWASNRPTPPGVIFKAVKFSPDGKELAAIVQLPNPVNAGTTIPTIVVWDFTNGKRLTQTAIERGNSGGLTLSGTEPLQWFPDKNGFLINQQLVVNRSDGKVLDILKSEGHIDSHFAANVIDDHRVFIYKPLNKLTVRTIKR